MPYLNDQAAQQVEELVNSHDYQSAKSIFCGITTTVKLLSFFGLCKLKVTTKTEDADTVVSFQNPLLVNHQLVVHPDGSITQVLGRKPATFNSTSEAVVEFCESEGIKFNR